MVFLQPFDAALATFLLILLFGFSTIPFNYVSFFFKDLFEFPMLSFMHMLHSPCCLRSTPFYQSKTYHWFLS
jgi:hypothetical protein